MSLTITEKTARKLYPDIPEWFREELENVFGKKALKELSFKDIKTFDDACEMLGLNRDAVLIGCQTIDEIAYRKIKIIASAINQGWEPDWDNTNQQKWYPYFKLSSGFGFSDSGCSYGSASAGVGSRLCFETEEKAKYAGSQFTDIYKNFLK